MRRLHEQAPTFKTHADKEELTKETSMGGAERQKENLRHRLQGQARLKKRRAVFSGNNLREVWEENTASIHWAGNGGPVWPRRAGFGGLVLRGCRCFGWGLNESRGRREMEWTWTPSLRRLEGGHMPPLLHEGAVTLPWRSERDDKFPFCPPPSNKKSEF